MNAKRAAYQSKVYKKILDKRGKRQLIKYLNNRIKEAVKEGGTFIRVFIEKQELMWKHSPYVAEYFEAKGYYYSCKINEILDDDYDIIIKWGETQKKEGIDNNE